MPDRNWLRRPSAIVVPMIAISLSSLAEAAEGGAPLNGAKPEEITIVSTEFRYAPAKVVVPAGRPVTLVLDNSGAETEHGLFLPAFGLRLQASAGEIARKTITFDKPGSYEFGCDLPGHKEAGMKGKLSVAGF